VAGDDADAAIIDLTRFAGVMSLLRQILTRRPGAHNAPGIAAAGMAAHRRRRGRADRHCANPKLRALGIRRHGPKIPTLIRIRSTGNDVIAIIIIDK
jgi:hypothetical protein